MDSATDARWSDRIALQWLLATGLLACATLYAELSLWVSVVLVLAVAWRSVNERFHFYRPGRIVRYLLLTLVAFAVYRDYGSWFGRDPGLALLVSLLGLKLLEMRSRRDAMLVLFLCYVVLAGGFLFEQTLLGTLWAVGTVVVSLAALIRLQQALPTRALMRLTGELLFKALPLLLMFYLLFPRMSGTLWGMPTDAHSAVTGMSEEMQPGSIRNVSE